MRAMRRYVYRSGCIRGTRARYQTSEGGQVAHDARQADSVDGTDEAARLVQYNTVRSHSHICIGRRTSGVGLDESNFLSTLRRSGTVVETNVTGRRVVSCRVNNSRYRYVWGEGRDPGWGG